MARLGSQAVAGYYPFPPSLLSAVAARLDLAAWHTPATADAPRTLVAFDPCCGEGVALLGLLQHALGSCITGEDPTIHLQVYGCELEVHRARRAHRLWTTSLPTPHQTLVEQSDLFRLRLPSVLPTSAPGAHILWLNPPYDSDAEYGRLEERFLCWTTSLLRPGTGLLCFVIPRHAVAASAATLAREYQALQVYRLPDPHFALFKQVIVFGQRRLQPCTLPTLCDPEIARLRDLTHDDAAVPVLPSTAPPDFVLARQPGGLPPLPVVPVRLDTLRSHLRFWMSGSTSVADTSDAHSLIPLAAVGAHQTLADFCGATHPSALPPLPTHTALILASGMINGQTVRPDHPDSDLPPLVITGHFQRVIQPTEVNENARGEVTSVKYDEQPRLRVDLLALTQPPTFYTLKDGTEPTGTTDLEQMNTADLLAHYGRNLAGLIQAQFPPLHDPADPAHQLPLPALARPLFAAQSHAVCALLKVAGVLGENPLLVGEMGTGKTAMLLNLAWALAPTNQPAMRAALRAQFGPQSTLPIVRHALIACPPHLVDNWEREIRRVLPAARVRRIERIADLHRPAPPPPVGSATLGQDLTFDLLSREASKLGHAYSPHALDRLPIPPRHQALADYLSSARRGGLTTMAQITAHLRQITGDPDLALRCATTDDLRRTTASLDPPSPTIRCARCGTPASEDAATLSAKRARCGYQPRQPTGLLGPLLRPLAALLAPFYPDSATIQALHPQPAAAAARAPRPLAAWRTSTSSTLSNSSPLSHLLLGRDLVAAATPPSPPVEMLAGWYNTLCQTPNRDTADDWAAVVQAYTRTLTELHHHLLAQPQATRDSVLEPTLQDILRQFTAEPAPEDLPPLVAPFVRRLLALFSLGPTRTALHTALNAILPLRALPEPPPLPPTGMTGLVDIILRHYDTGRFAGITELLGSLTGLVTALPAPERAAVIPAVVTRLYPRTANQPRPYGTGAAVRQACCVLLALLPEPDTRQQLIAALRPRIPLEGERSPLMNPWEHLNSTLATLAAQARQLPDSLDPASRAELEAAYPPVSPTRPGAAGFSELSLDLTSGTLLWERQHPVGSPAPALRALETLLALTPFAEGAPCGEPLVQAIPQPRRVALSRYILKHYRHAYQLVALDEAHEANHAETAQGQAYYRLTALPGTITVALTGTPMNGYASSVFALWWHLNRGFRRLFRRTDRERFIRQYGYRRLIGRVDDKRRDGDTSRRLRGSQSDAIVGGLRMEVVGEAPGMAPTFLVHLLPHSVPIHLAHLDQVLPPREQQRLPVAVTADQDPVGAEMLAAYQALMKRLVDQIRASLRDPDTAGKLWGHLFEAGLSYPILCTSDTGNSLDADGQPTYRLTYPASCGEHYSGQVLAEAPLFPATVRLPHETTLLTTVRRELAAGRNVIVYLRHTGTPRLAQRLVRVLGAAAPAIYLDVSRVPPAKRDAWITQHVIGRRMPVLLTNAEAVKTGLNCLTPYFKTAVWLEPTMNTATFRQAGARIRRIGSHPTDPIREYLLYYADTAQAAAIDLILQKVQHSQLFDGLDLQTSLAAAGVQNDDLTFLLGSGTVSFGKALYQHLQANHQLLRALPFAVPTAAPIPVVAPPEPDEPVLKASVRDRPVQLSLFG